MGRRKQKLALGRISMQLPLQSNQTLSGFISNVAAHNGFRSVTRFCFAMGINLSRLAQGDREQLGQLAEVSGISAEELSRVGTWRHDQGFLHAGELLGWLDIRRRAHFCPDCAEEDRLANKTVRSSARVLNRPAWSHEMVRICAKHNVRLVPLPDFEGQKPFRDDLAAQLQQAAKTDAIPERIPEPANCVDRYITDRYAGTPSSDFESETLLDVLFLACFLGMSHRPGPAPSVPAEPEKRFEATEKGLAVVLSGEAAVEARLREIVHLANPDGACEIGLRRIFGDLYDRLNRRDRSALKSIRRMLATIGADLHLIKFDDRACLGLPVPPRRLQTLDSARRRFGLSLREMRGILSELGLMPEEKMTARANQVLIDLTDATEFLGQLNHCINLKAAAGVLGILPQHLVKLCDAKIIEPFFVRHSEDLKPLRYFRREDLAAFIAALGRKAIKSGDDTLLDIWTAGLKVCRQPADIIAAIAEGQISCLYRSGPVRTLLDIRLSLEDVRAGMHEDSTVDLVTAEDCCSVLGINITAMRKILHAGIMASVRATNPVNLRQQMAVRSEDLDKFKETYVSLNALRQEWGCTPNAMRRALINCEVSTAFATSETEVRIYRRADVDGVRHRLQVLL